MFQLFQLFQKKPAAQSLEALQAQLDNALRRKDAPKMAQAYYGLGVYYMERDDPERADLYLGRSDAIFSARDDIYDKVPESVREDCAQRLAQLESMSLLPGRLTAQIEARAEQLDSVQLRLWGLMTLARLNKVGLALSTVPGCQILGQFRRAVELTLRSFQTSITGEEVQFLQNACSQLYALGDDPCFWDSTQQVELPGRPPMQLFDLNGMLTLTEIDLYLNSHLTLLIEGEENSSLETGLIPCALLPDYFLRTGTGRLEDVPKIKLEMERIWSDYQFIRSKISWKEVSRRVEQYLELDILA
jgi:hypothetical protein